MLIEMITSINEFRKYLNENKTLIGGNYGGSDSLYDTELLELLGINNDTKITPEIIMNAFNIAVYVDALKKAGVTDMEHKDRSSNDENKMVVSSFTRHRIRRAIINKFVTNYIRDNNLHIYDTDKLLKHIEYSHNSNVNSIEAAERTKQRIIDEILKASQASGNIQDLDFISFDGSVLELQVIYTDTTEGEELDSDVYLVNVKDKTRVSGKYRRQTLESPEEYPEVEWNYIIDKNAVQQMADGTKQNVVLSDTLYNLLEERILDDAQHNDNSIFIKDNDGPY